MNPSMNMGVLLTLYLIDTIQTLHVMSHNIRGCYHLQPSLTVGSYLLCRFLIASLNILASNFFHWLSSDASSSLGSSLQAHTLRTPSNSSVSQQLASLPQPHHLEIEPDEEIESYHHTGTEEVLDHDEDESQENYWERYIIQKGEYYHCGYQLEQGKYCTYHGNRQLANLKRHIIATHLNTR